MNLNTIIVTLDYLIRKVMALLDSLMERLGITTTAPETTTVADGETTTAPAAEV